MRIPMPSPTGKNLARKFIDSSFLVSPRRLAMDSMPRKLARDDDPPMYPEGGTQGVKNMGKDPMGVDALFNKIMSGSKLSADELAALGNALGGEMGEDGQITFGPLDKPPPSPTATPTAEDESEKMRDELRAKVFSEDDVNRILPQQGADQLPKNAQTNNEVLGGKMGGRIAEPIGMDGILREAGRRFAPRRGEGFSIPQFAEPKSTTAAGMDSAAEDEMNRMFPGIERIEHA
jgi:hypothetical protein